VRLWKGFCFGEFGLLGGGCGRGSCPSTFDALKGYTPSEVFWSSTKYAPSPGGAWYVNFYGGDAGAGGVDNAGRVRCVR
jgi:hypothetical protein